MYIYIYNTSKRPVRIPSILLKQFAGLLADPISIIFTISYST